MTNQTFPNTDQLREMYKDVFSNEAVTVLSHWTDSNCSDAMDEKAYLSLALETCGDVLDNMERAIQGIGR